MFTIYTSIMVVCWVAFMAYWSYSALSMKRTLKNPARGWSLLIRVAILVAVLLTVHFVAPSVRIRPQFASEVNPWIGGVGSLCVIAGIALAIWARTILGRNWGMPMSVKEKPELITSGPYRVLRHPIYSGVLLALLGSALVVGVWWLIIFVAGTLYFVYSARQEEKLMTKEFPDQYPAYKNRTFALIPFVW